MSPGSVIFWPPSGEDPNQAIFVVLMFAPTVGAVLAWAFGGGRIQWGRPNWWILAGLIPAIAVLGVYLLGSMVGWDVVDPSLLRSALTAAPVAIFSASLSAIGEEIGWRGFLWPLLRGRSGFWISSLIIGVIWWVYHVPLIIFGWYGDLAHLPAFTVAIVGITLFIGRHHRPVAVAVAQRHHPRGVERAGRHQLRRHRGHREGARVRRQRPADGRVRLAGRRHQPRRRAGGSPVAHAHDGRPHAGLHAMRRGSMLTVRFGAVLVASYRPRTGRMRGI